MSDRPVKAGGIAKRDGKVKFKSTALIAAMCFSVAAAPVFAGGMAEPVMEPEVIAEESSSSGGFIIPLLLLAIIVAIATSDNGGGEVF
jgi:hypothetical protein